MSYRSRAPALFFVLALGIRPPAGSEPPVSAWVVDTLEKIFPDTPPPKGGTGILTFHAARGEYESGQIALRPDRDLAGVTLRFEPLRSEEDGSELPGGCLRFNFAGWIRLAKNTPATPRERLVREAPCEVPDPLLAEPVLDLELVPWGLVRVSREADGRLSFDYSDFDRYVELLHQAGVADRLEIQHVARFGEGGWSSSRIEFRTVAATDRSTGKTLPLRFEEGLAPLLADLQRHLREKGWLEKSMIHVADEPSLHNVESWRECSRQVRRAAPLLRRIDAIEASDFGGDLEVWVPKLSHLRNWFDGYKRAQAAGAELWYYICCHPTGGRYPNRFLDYPLCKVRVLHWLNWAYGITGYLHWGLNSWGNDPFGVPPERLPPGDTHVLYPGPDGPLDSLRWEVQRDSLEDYEYLWLLTERLGRVKARLGRAAEDFDPAQRSREICRRVVASFTETADRPEEIRAARAEAAAEIAAAAQDPPVLLWTRPPANTDLVPGPVVVEVYGAVLPGTQVRLDGAEVRVGPEGRFARTVGLSKARPSVAVTVSRDGRSKTLTRSFRVE